MQRGIGNSNNFITTAIEVLIPVGKPIVSTFFAATILPIVAPALTGLDFMLALSIIAIPSAAVNFLYSFSFRERGRNALVGGLIAVGLPIAIGVGMWAMGCFPPQYFPYTNPGEDTFTGNPRFKIPFS